VRIKENIEYLQKLVNLSDEYAPKPLNISNQIKINYYPLAQYHQRKELSQLSSNKYDHFDLSPPIPPPKRRPTEDYNRKGNTKNYGGDCDDVHCPLIKRRYDGSDSESDSDNELPPLGNRRYDDSSSDDDSADGGGSPPLSRYEYDSDDSDDTASSSVPVARKRTTSRRTFIRDAFVKAYNLSRDLSPLSPNDEQNFSPSKLTINHSCNGSELPIVIASGASVKVTLVVADFVGPLLTSRLTSLQGLSVKSNVLGDDAVCWNFFDVLGQVHQLRINA
jgi:hypothetical protein